MIDFSLIDLSRLHIPIANVWMQNPVGAVFNPDAMRIAQANFACTASAGHVTRSAFVMAGSRHANGGRTVLWYFSLILSVARAGAVIILNTMWFQVREDRRKPVVRSGQ